MSNEKELDEFFEIVGTEERWNEDPNQWKWDGIPPAPPPKKLLKARWERYANDIGSSATNLPDSRLIDIDLTALTCLRDHIIEGVYNSILERKKK